MAKQGDWVCVGAIAGAHGVKGDVKIRSFTQAPEDCFAYGPLHDEAGKPLIDPVSVRPQNTVFIATTDGKTSREAWEGMKGTKLYVPRSGLPEPDEDEFYYDDLQNMQVLHVDGRALGRVKSVQNFGADDLLEVIAPDKRTAYYLPFTKDVVPTIRLSEGELLADPPEAFLPEDMQMDGEEQQP